MPINGYNPTSVLAEVVLALRAKVSALEVMLVSGALREDRYLCALYDDTMVLVADIIDNKTIMKLYCFVDQRKNVIVHNNRTDAVNLAERWNQNAKIADPKEPLLVKVMSTREYAEVYRKSLMEILNNVMSKYKG